MTKRAYEDTVGTARGKMDYTPRKRSRLAFQFSDSASEEEEEAAGGGRGGSPSAKAAKRHATRTSMHNADEEMHDASLSEAKAVAQALKEGRKQRSAAKKGGAAAPEPDTIVNENIPPTSNTAPKRGPGRPKSTPTTRRTKDAVTPKTTGGKKLFATPLKLRETPGGSTAADRSARRKSTRTLIERTLNNSLSDDEEDEEVAREIYDDPIELDSAKLDSPSNPYRYTPPKRAKATTKRKAKARSPSPDLNLPPHELYFAQNKAKAAPTSNNTMASVPLMDHSEYFSLLEKHTEPHAAQTQRLLAAQESMFPQYNFEFREGFNILLYGFGSKREILHSYAAYLKTRDKYTKIVIVNGYNSRTTLKDILTTITTLMPMCDKPSGSQPTDILAAIWKHISMLQHYQSSYRIYILIHTLDSPNLRKPQTQMLLARLASHPAIHVLASVDTPGFGSLWDQGLRETFGWVMHDATTFAPYEVERQAVDTMNALLGRKGRRVGGREGVLYVLKSLNAKARQLYQLIVTEQLLAMDLAEGGDGNGGAAGGGGGEQDAGIEFRALLAKGQEEFIFTAESGLRSMLKEFTDHEMIVVKQDAFGQEILCAPFRREELEGMLEDMMA